ncbi:Calx-beta domain-containing protein [Actinoplanes friuliensis]|uniref:Calx-beta domain-containing protein n=1 Tax=Actinoplanes friuliensis DSM 7358 TaxID=1246995 RepID=U5W6W8_9ACTN|nr:Calx-beta domain-containing protein [Actinoplanes friuliensis]AGZ44948.1 hypothetical protein AFR_33450 [Actinoplanes friuliensis DSM 7358]
MRYSPAHAAKSGSVPFMLRGPKSAKTILSAAVAGVVGLVPAVLIASPAMAAVTYTWTDSTPNATEAQPVTAELTWADSDPLGTAPTTYTWSTAEGTAKAGYDFTPVTGATVTFTNGKANFSVTTLADTVYEGDESFDIVVNNGNVAVATATATINDEDIAPTYTMTANKTTVTEGTDTAVTVTVKLDAASAAPVSIPITTEDGSGANGAKAGSDYTTYSTPVTFAPSETTKQFTVPILNDTTDEDDQTFTIKASAGTGVTGTASPITITIADEDAAPAVKFNSATASIEEGKDLKFPVSLTAPSEKTVTVKYDTSDLTAGAQPNGEGLASAGKDYTAVSAGVVTFAPGDTLKDAVVKTTTDDLDEITPEDFQATLSAPTNATLGMPATSIGKIADPNTTTSPTVTLTPTTVKEGNATASQTFTVKLSKASGKTQVVHWIAGTGLGQTATANADYKSASGDLTFAPGDLEKTFSVDILGDLTDEPDENFTLTLSNKDVASTLSNVSGDLKANTILITDDDDKPTYSVNNVSMAEGNTASVALYTLKLSNPTSTALTFNVTKVDDTAKSAPVGDPLTVFGTDDYSVPVGTVTVPAGQPAGYAFALVNGDGIFEPDEAASLKFTPADVATTGAVTGASATGTLTLTNDDTAPVLNVVPVSGNEDDTVTVKGIVIGQSQAEVSLNVSFEGKSVGGTKAASADDFTNPGAQLVKIPVGTPVGAQIKIADVKLTKDSVAEPAETILVSGFGLSNTGSVKDGAITIAANGTTTPDPDPEEPGEDSITLDSSSDFRLGVGNITLSGKTTPGAKVQPWAQPLDSDAGLVEYGSEVTADSSGNFSFVGKFTKTGYKFAASINDGDLTSDPVTVFLKQDPDLFLRSSSRGQATLSVFGDPRVAGLSVRFLRANSNGTWSTVATGSLDSTGKLSRTLTGLKSGASYLYKVTVYGDGDVGLLTNTSKSARVTIR